ncbi:MAG: RDD family protein, partial [Chitinophagaceae bacterium]
MAVIKVPTNFNIDVEFEIPEFYRRLISLVIDMVVLFFYYKIAREILVSVVSNSDLSDTDTMYDLYGVWMLLLLPMLLYHVVMEITMNGQSVGKKIMGIKVVNENGGRPSISQFLIRWMLRDIWFFFLLAIGLQSVSVGKKGEGNFIVI